MFKSKYALICYMFIMFSPAILFSMSEESIRANVKKRQDAGFRSELRSLCTKTGCMVAAAAGATYFFPGAFGTMGGMGLLYLCKDKASDIASCYGFSEETENMKRAKKLNALEESFEISKDRFLEYNRREMMRLIGESRKFTGFGLKQVYEYDKKQADNLNTKIETVLKLPLHSTKPLPGIRPSLKELEKHLETYSESVHDNIMQAAIKINNLNQDRVQKGEMAKTSFWFIGEAGVGKTETAEVLAKALKRPFCKINLATISVDDLLGRAASNINDSSEKIGQVGAFTRCFLQPDVGTSSSNPIIFIDEVHDMLNGNDENARKLYSLLKVFTEGREREIHENGLGIKLDLSRVVFIFRSNSSIKGDVANALTSRIKTITFDELTKDQKLKIAENHFDRLATIHGYQQKSSDLSKVKEIVETDNSPGARVLINVIEEYIIHQQACCHQVLKCIVFDTAQTIKTFGGQVKQ